MTSPLRRVSSLHSMQAKYTFTYATVIAAVLILLNTYPVFASQDLVFQSKHASLQGQAALLSSSLGVSDSLTPQGVSQTVELLGETGLDRLLVVDAAGIILYDSIGPDTLYRHALFSELAGALSGRDVFRSEYRNGSFTSRAAAPITYRNLTTGAVYLLEIDTEQGALLTGLQSNLRTISLVICVLVLLFSILFSRLLSQRIATLSHAMGIVREGEYSHRVSLPGQDEFSLLADEFNRLTHRLQATDEARRRFVSDASHELKTPLASIQLLSDSILQSPNMEKQTVLEFVSDIGSEAQRLTRISEKLLTLTRLDAALPTKKEPVSISHVVKQTALILSPVAQAEKIALSLSLDPVSPVLANRDDLSQITFNLMENALKYTPAGGQVTVSLREEEGGVTLAVADTGVGIPEADREKIFDRFYRVDKARSRAAGGTGLGLSIAKDMVLLHGGTISVAPNHPTGSVFTVTFPRREEDAL